MADYDRYHSIEDFYQAIQRGEIDPATCTAHVDCGDFFVLSDKEEELISGDERDLLPAFFKICGIPIAEVEGEGE